MYEHTGVTILQWSLQYTLKPVWLDHLFRMSSYNWCNSQRTLFFIETFCTNSLYTLCPQCEQFIFRCNVQTLVCFSMHVEGGVCRLPSFTSINHLESLLKRRVNYPFTSFSYNIFDLTDSYVTTRMICTMSTNIASHIAGKKLSISSS